MRGKVLIHVAHDVLIGITPAYAGKSAFVRLLTFSARDHPRLCGEKDYFFTGIRKTRGSPPPMRGKAGQYIIICTALRITPAYAGKSSVFFI